MKPFSGLLAALLAAFVAPAYSALVIIPQSSLTPITQLYTDSIGGGIGAVAVMTGGGNAANVGGATGRNDDGFAAQNFNFSGGSTLPFFGSNYSSYFANNNGNISFTSGNSGFIPTGPIGATVPTISVWFGDVDTRAATSGVMHVRNDLDQTIVTWDNVGRFGARGDLLNEFQMVVRGPNYVIPTGEGAIGFFWLDMPWETTDTSVTAAIGFGDGAGNGVVLEGSNTPGLNNVVEFHSTWFNADLTPVCGVAGTPDCAVLPEPGSLALLGLALVGFGLSRRRVKKA